VALSREQRIRSRYLLTLNGKLLAQAGLINVTSDPGEEWNVKSVK